MGKPYKLGDKVYFKHHYKRGWLITDLSSLRKADVFRIGVVRNVEVPVKSKVVVRYCDENGDNVWIATSDPYKDDQGNLTINTLY